jgi:hypothetical protein
MVCSQLPAGTQAYRQTVAQRGESYLTCGAGVFVVRELCASGYRFRINANIARI